jgi:hypothetical protein
MNNRFCCDGRCDKGARCPAFADGVLGDDAAKPPGTLRPLLVMLLASAAAMAWALWGAPW